MKTVRIISFLLSVILSLGLLCACNAQSSQTNQKESEAQSETAPAEKEGTSLLTGKGKPSNDKGSVGDSYIDLDGEEWGFYVKGENGWELLGYLEVDPAPLTMSDLNGTYALCYVVSNSRTYNIGDVFAGMTLSDSMIQAELHEGTGKLTINFSSLETTNITCTMEYDKFIMICENAINITGQPSSVYQLSIVRDGSIFLVLEVAGTYYYVKKIS